MRPSGRIALLTILAALAATGCSTQVEIASTGTPTQLSPTTTPTVTKPADTATQVPQPSVTSIPTSTRTSAPPPPLSGSGGGVLAFTSERDGNFELYLMNADGSDPRRLTNQAGDDYWTTWSPDGEQIAFASERTGS